MGHSIGTNLHQKLPPSLENSLLLYYFTICQKSVRRHFPWHPLQSLCHALWSPLTCLSATQFVTEDSRVDGGRKDFPWQAHPDLPERVSNVARTFTQVQFGRYLYFIWFTANSYWHSTTFKKRDIEFVGENLRMLFPTLVFIEITARVTHNRRHEWSGLQRAHYEFI